METLFELCAWIAKKSEPTTNSTRLLFASPTEKGVALTICNNNNNGKFIALSGKAKTIKERINHMHPLTQSSAKKHQQEKIGETEDPAVVPTSGSRPVSTLIEDEAYCSSNKVVFHS